MYINEKIFEFQPSKLNTVDAGHNFKKKIHALFFYFLSYLEQFQAQFAPIKLKTAEMQIPK